MLTFCVFRRYGILAPGTLLLLGCLMEYLVNKKHPDDDSYYSTHLWTIGLTFTLTGLLLTAFVYVMAPPHGRNSSTSSASEYTPLDLDMPSVGGSLLPKAETASSRFMKMLPTKEDLYDFAVTPSDTDMFCYVPMNWCALGILGFGIVLLVADGVKSLL